MTAVDEDVGRLDVAVDEPGDVRGVEGGGDLAADVEHPVGAEAALLAQDRGEVRPGDVLHGDVEQAVDLARVVDRDDVGMRERGGDARLAQEALAEVRVVGQIGRDDLQRGAAAQGLVLGQVDDAHAAPTDAVLDPVPGHDVARTWV